MTHKESMRAAIGCSGIVRVGTGIGVLQRALYPRLRSRDFDLALSDNRDLGSGTLNRLRGLALGLTPAKGTFAAYLSVVPPLPFNVDAPLVSVVHDLRWLNTRSSIGRAYRHYDLRRTVARSSRLVCISDRTFEDLVQVFPNAAAKSTVAWLGPGLVNRQSVGASGSEAGLVLLVGGAEHKRNAYAADVIAHMSTAIDIRVAGVGLAESVRSKLEGTLGRDRCEWYRNISDEEMETLYHRAQYFFLFSVSEGFGLPYIEALASDCIVVATDQALTREILGESAILVPDIDPSDVAKFVLTAAPPSEEARRRRASRYSWDTFAEVVASELRSVASE